MDATALREFAERIERASREAAEKQMALEEQALQQQHLIQQLQAQLKGKDDSVATLEEQVRP